MTTACDLRLKLLQKVLPVYPAAARTARIQGEVVLEIVVDPDGRVSLTRVLSGHILLQQAAMDAVQQWVYSPMFLNGQAVEVLTTVSLNFNFQ